MFYLLHLLQWGSVNPKEAPSYLQISGKDMHFGRVFLGRLFAFAGQLEVQRDTPTTPSALDSPIPIAEGQLRLRSPISLRSPAAESFSLPDHLQLSALDSFPTTPNLGQPIEDDDIDMPAQRVYPCYSLERTH